eukprot:46292_1
MATPSSPRQKAPTPPKPPRKQAPIVPFTDTKQWNRTLRIISHQYAKTKIELKWTFVVNNTSHDAVLTHSQKRNPLAASSRALYVDDIKIYCNHCKLNLFMTKIEGEVLKFKIAYSDNKYQYSLCINDIPHPIAYKRWMSRRSDEKDKKPNDNRTDTFNAKSKQFCGKNKLPPFSSLKQYVPTQSYESVSDDSSFNLMAQCNK